MKIFSGKGLLRLLRYRGQVLGHFLIKKILAPKNLVGYLANF